MYKFSKKDIKRLKKEFSPEDVAKFKKIFTKSNYDKYRTKWFRVDQSSLPDISSFNRTHMIRKKLAKKCTNVYMIAIFSMTGHPIAKLLLNYEQMDFKVKFVYRDELTEAEIIAETNKKLIYTRACQLHFKVASITSRKKCRPDKDAPEMDINFCIKLATEQLRKEGRLHV